ncbi:MAG: tetratricopeptide repeat protein [Alphaproteobacteria bacterium]|nr:tetratricopeptide repeat protein [Alphaproteobacteria bacterium]
MKRFGAAATLFCALSLLAGCEDAPWHIDPLDVNGRDGGGTPLSYSTLMRIGAAAHAAGDLPTAVSVYRRAAAVDTHAVAPFVASGNTLLEMGQTSEAIIAYNSALARNAHDGEALRGLARSYLMTGKPELAGQPLSVAFQDTPDDPKLLELIGVADDFVGQHEEAQARYKRGLELLPGDAALSLDLALSMAITGDYPQAVAILQPIATAPGSSARDRQTLALIYGLQGNRPAAEHFARIDLNPQGVARNLAFYDNLRRLTPAARQRAIQTLTLQGGAHHS